MFFYKEDSISYDGELFNPYSLIYYFRTLEFSSDANYEIQVVDNKKVTPLKFFADKKVKTKDQISELFNKKDISNMLLNYFESVQVKDFYYDLIKKIILYFDKRDNHFFSCKEIISLVR